MQLYFVLDHLKKLKMDYLSERFQRNEIDVPQMNFGLFI
jgi:hypothetical protein